MRVVLFFSLITLFLFHVEGKDLNYSFTKYSVENGLSQNTVNVIYQDSYGFMWFGTDNGLNKFDGYKFVVYQHNPIDSSSISANLVVAIYEDKQRNLWIGNNYNGLNLYDRKRDIFTHFEHNPSDLQSLSSNNIRAIFEDTKGNLWIGTSGGGLNLFNKESGSFKHFTKDITSKNSIGSNYISSISEDENGKIWLGTTEGILISYQPEIDKFVNYIIFPNFIGDINNTTYGKILIDDDKIWFGGESGLAIFKLKTSTPTLIKSQSSNNNISNYPISSIVSLDKNLILIGSDHGGIHLYDKSSDTFTQYLHDKNDPKSISNNQVFSVYKDRESNIWLGNFSGGINLLNYNDQKFNSKVKYSNLSINYSNSILGLTEDQQGNIWISTDGDGVFLLNPKTLTLNKPNPNNPLISDVVKSLYTDSNGLIWLGTYRNGLLSYSPQKRIYTHYIHDRDKPTSISGNNVWSICEDSKHQMWFGTIGYGLNLLDKATGTFSQFLTKPDDSNSISNNDVFKITEDIDGKIWCGTRNGLNIFDPEKKSFFRFNEQKNNANLYGTWIYEIFLDSKHNMWVGTDLAINLYNRDTKTFSHFSEADGLKGNSILGILDDKKGRFWISTNKGISCFNPDTKKFRNYDVTDGLQSNEFNYTSCFKTHDGRLFFGGVKGLNFFYPDSVKDNLFIPPIFLTDFRVFNKPVSVRDSNSLLRENLNFVKQIDLNYTYSVISFEFAALNYINNSKNQYAYYLEGFDQGWNNIDNKREVTYTNLNPGKYIFHIKGSNNDGGWNEEGKSVILNILPPFYKTYWFYILELILLAGSIYSYIIFREKRLLKDKKTLQKKVAERTLKIELQKQELEHHRFNLENLVENRTAELKLAKEKAEESDSLKSAFLANMSHEIRTPMNAIVGFSNLLISEGTSLEERQQFIEFINKNTEELLMLINDILDLSLTVSNQMILEIKSVSLSQISESIKKVVESLNKKEGVDLIFSNRIDNSTTMVSIDIDKMIHIVRNLLNNAVKFTDKGFVKVDLRRTNNTLEIQVSDTGIGICESDLEIIFESFRKVDADANRIFRGTGLGLSLCKNLAELMSGTISVTSKVGEGSCFTITLPLQN